jgi:hypothetical protein
MELSKEYSKKWDTSPNATYPNCLSRSLPQNLIQKPLKRVGFIFFGGVTGLAFIFPPSSVYVFNTWLKVFCSRRFFYKKAFKILMGMLFKGSSLQNITRQIEEPFCDEAFQSKGS